VAVIPVCMQTSMVQQHAAGCLYSRALQLQAGSCAPGCNIPTLCVYTLDMAAPSSSRLQQGQAAEFHGAGSFKCLQ
jgi:hypothetical protein